ncbi:MAG: M20 family metallopeptidase, partial [Clostridium sp.]|nr:M20 family metallopeptidase [Clostridium sp.]
RLAKEMDFLLETFQDLNGKHLGIGFTDEPSGELTCNLGLMRFEDEVLKLTLDIRIPVTYSNQDVEGPLKLKFAPKGWDVAFGEFTPPLYYPEDLPMIQSLMDVYRSVTGDQKAKPVAIGGGTYAKAMDNIVAFGPGLPGRDEVAHIADEYIFIEDLLLWTKIYAEAILALSKL